MCSTERGVTMKKITIVLAILAISIIFAQGSYAGMDDKSDRLSNEQSSVFSPGYINAAKQKADAIIYQSSKQKDFWENPVDYIKDKLSNKVREDAVEKPQPELKKKQGAANSTKSAGKTEEIESVNTKLIDSTHYNVNIGTGKDKRTDDNGRIISEVFTIDGKDVRHIYAGFDTVGTTGISAAIALAGDGDIILVRGGKSYGIEGSGYGFWQTIYLSEDKELSIYGGYGEDGVRDIKNNVTTITGCFNITNVNKPVVIDGFTMNGKVKDTYRSYYNTIEIANSSNVTIANNTFNKINTYSSAINVDNSSVLLRDNNFNASRAVFISGQVTVPGLIVLDSNETIPSCTEGALSNITSIDNNYNGSLAFYAYGLSNVSSTGDYFSRTDIGWYDFSERATGFGSPSFHDARGQLNTSVYSIPLTLTYLATSYVPATTTTTMQNSYLQQQSFFLNETNYYSNFKEFDRLEVGSILKGFLANKDSSKLNDAAAGPIDQALAVKLTQGYLRFDAMAVPIDQAAREQAAEAAGHLADIFKNPSEDQKIILDAMKTLLNDVNKVEDPSNQSPELQKASDDLLQVVASILIAQAIPDLLKEGDVAGIKNIFTELNITKGKIMIDYQEAVKPYYEEVKKLLAKNMAMVQLSNIVPKSIMVDELFKMSPNDLDKIFEKLHKASNRSFEEEYILQQEAKYRKQYIDPNKKIFEDKMKDMMNDFTKKLSGVLEGTKSEKR